MDFSSNQIFTADDSFVESIKLMEMHRLVTLILDDNQYRYQYRCDCDTLTFLKWTQSTNSVIEKKRMLLVVIVV